MISNMTAMDDTLNEKKTLAQNYARNGNLDDVDAVVTSTATSTTTVMEVVGERKKSASLPIERILYPQRYYTQEMRLVFFSILRGICVFTL